MPWIWSCHKCHTRYLLGATRRCLYDGHYFCGGSTVDKISGKVKKHRACVSEFDYSGWEDFSRWKRATTGQNATLGSKHCEDECNFPSSCHWKEEHAVQETGMTYNDTCCLDKEPDVSSVEVEGKLTDRKGTEDYIGKVRKAAERRRTQAARASLSTIEEEDQQASSFPDATPRLNGLGLHYSVVDFSSSKAGADETCGIVGKSQMKLMTSNSLQLLALVDDIWEEDVDMTDWTDDATESPSVSPCGQPEAVQVPFDFRFEQDDGRAASLAEDDVPVSALRSPWNWTAGDIGVALSPRDLSAEGETWED